MDGEALNPAIAISIATPPIASLNPSSTAIVMSTVVSLLPFHSVIDVTPSAPSIVDRDEKPLPTVQVLSAPVVAANAPNGTFPLLPNAPKVTVRVVAPTVSSLLVADWTMAPEPFVPEVAVPVTSSICQLISD